MTKSRDFLGNSGEAQLTVKPMKGEIYKIQLFKVLAYSSSPHALSFLRFFASRHSHARDTCYQSRVCVSLPRIEICQLKRDKEDRGLQEGNTEEQRWLSEIVSTTPVVVFSKTYCGYCNRVKQLFTQLGAVSRVIELDEESDGGEMQSALAEWTGQRTVPNVFIGEKHTGGSDAVMEKYQSETLLPLLMEAEAGATANNYA